MASAYINIPAYGSASWKDPVPSAVNLPTNGNQPGDARVALDTDTIYLWSGSIWVAAASGGPGVTSLNSLTGTLALVAGSGITVTPSGSTITIASTGGGTVSSVSVVSANGFTGTVANPTTTPALTLATTFTGIAYSNGTGLATAVAANFPTLNQNTTGTSANGFFYLASNFSVYGGTHSTLSFTGFDNTVIGVDSGTALTTGQGNTFLGAAAGGDATTLDYSVGIGAGAIGGAATSAADGAIAIGYQAGSSLTTADGFTAVGYRAGGLNSTGQGNTYLGWSAGSNQVNTESNTAVGWAAGINASANAGVAVGWNSRYSTLTTSIGNQAGSNDAVSVFVGAYTSGDNGHFAETIVGANSFAGGGNNVAIGQASAAGISGAGNCVAVGQGAAAGRTGSGGAAIAVGYGASTTGAESVCLGGLASDGGNNYSLVVGQAKPNNTNCLVFGLTANQSAAVTTTASNQVTFGTSGAQAIPLSDFYLGRGAVGDATAPSCSVQPSPTVGANIAGGNLKMAAGNGTGTGGSGSILLQTAPAAASSSTPNTPVTVLSVAPTGIVTVGAASTTPIHAINGLTTPGGGTSALFTNVPTGATTPTGYLEITINGVLSYIPYFQ